VLYLCLRPRPNLGPAVGCAELAAVALTKAIAAHWQITILFPYTPAANRTLPSL
jgi:hypothetical protein